MWLKRSLSGWSCRWGRSRGRAFGDGCRAKHLLHSFLSFLGFFLLDITQRFLGLGHWCRSFSVLEMGVECRGRKVSGGSEEERRVD